jgi:hypothetical protein
VHHSQLEVSNDSAVSFIFSSLCGSSKLSESQKEPFLNTADNEVSVYGLVKAVMTLYAGPAGSGGATSGRAMRPGLLLRHIKNAMMNAHKNRRIRPTPLGIESNRPI